MSLSRFRLKGFSARCSIGLGSDGTVGANHNSIKIIGEETDNYAQAYFVYDSKKAGAVTVSHLRFGKKLIRRPYLITEADFIACHNPSFLEKYDMLSIGSAGGDFLDDHAVRQRQGLGHFAAGGAEADNRQKAEILSLLMRSRLPRSLVLAAEINVIMQTAFFKISNIIPLEIAVRAIKDAIKKTYGKKGEKVVQMNNAAVDAALDKVYEVKVPEQSNQQDKDAAGRAGECSRVCQEVTAELMAFHGDKLPVSKMPDDGKFPTGTTKYEKRNIAVDIPQWEPKVCIQCGTCSFVCPHATIRIKAYDPEVSGRCTGDIQECRCERQGICRHEVYRSGGSGRLHRLRRLCAGLSGTGKGRRTSSRPDVRR